MDFRRNHLVAALVMAVLAIWITVALLVQAGA